MENAKSKIDEMTKALLEGDYLTMRRLYKELGGTFEGEKMIDSPNDLMVKHGIQIKKLPDGNE